ncbi:hypothetical protein EJ05DRAFT_253691 [Pseudovirgaria hyperparasitica]|uniref:Uncharacterized protein n=1 Tax=Pseudovirgaria hyperparasitica TaxID=470096 RepID=A0A6A6WG00_9PEZI|nr:uncharacterized protein EJ05DRAFT_253691 [Pseudovirgaria hyperparasitica]KAF2761129.1 hypothetical protein EJ05DRAFT_253691 [Pseudovirgaria hyperparasitica]
MESCRRVGFKPARERRDWRGGESHGNSRIRQPGCVIPGKKKTQLESQAVAGCRQLSLPQTFEMMMPAGMGMLRACAAMCHVRAAADEHGLKFRFRVMMRGERGGMVDGRYGHRSRYGIRWMAVNPQPTIQQYTIHRRGRAEIESAASHRTAQTSESPFNLEPMSVCNHPGEQQHSSKIHSTLIIQRYPASPRGSTVNKQDEMSLSFVSPAGIVCF